MQIFTNPSNLFLRISILLIFLLSTSILLLANCPPYQIPVIKTASNYANVVYIDPSASTNGNGSQASPFSSLPATLQPNTAYLFRRGTTHPYVSRVFTSVLIGAYGTGADPIISGIDVRNNSSNSTIRNIDIALRRSGTGDKVLAFNHLNTSRDITIAYCKIRGIANNGIFPRFGIEHSVDGLVFFNNEIFDIDNNGWWLAPNKNMKIIRNWFHRVNRGGENSTTSTGDGIQAEYGLPGAYIAGNIIDKSNSMWKYSLMLNGTQENNIVEYNTFISPKTGAGGAGVRWMAQTNGIFRKNVVRSISATGQQLVVPFDTWDSHANKAHPYGIRDNHVLAVSGAGLATNGVVLHSSNLRFTSNAAYDSYLASNPGIGLYGSDITPQNFWQPLCGSSNPPPPATYTVTFRVESEHDGSLINNAVVTLNGVSQPAGSYSFSGIAAGSYSYRVTAQGYQEVNVQSVQVSGNMTITVKMKPQTFSIALQSNPLNAGTLTGAGSYRWGQSATVSATPASTHNFVNWTENGNVVSTQASFSFTVNSNRNLIANFALKGHTVTFRIESEHDGSHIPNAVVTFNGQTQQAGNYIFNNVPAGSYSYKVTAPGFQEVNVQSVQVSGNITITVKMKPQMFTLTLQANPLNAGTLTGAGSYRWGQSATVSATAAQTHNFVNWTENGQVVSTQASFSFTVNSNRNLVANFAAKGHTVTFRVESEIDGSLINNATITFNNITQPAGHYSFTGVATGSYNYRVNVQGFEEVLVQGVQVSDNMQIVVRMKPLMFNISILMNPHNGGSVSGAGSYRWGQTVTLAAQANGAHQFLNWTENGNIVSTQPSFSFQASANRSLVANFDKKTHRLSYRSADKNTGGITGLAEQTVEHGSNGSPVTAVAAQGFHFVRWSDGSEQNPRTELNVTQDITVYAQFSVNTNVEFPEGERQISIYPVPVIDVLHAKIPSDEVYEISILSSHGQLILNLPAASRGDHKFNLSHLTTGMYFIRFATATGVVTRKFLKH